MTAIAAPNPMRRTFKEDRGIEFAVSALLHVALIGGLSLVLLTPPKPQPLPVSMDVTIADDVGLVASAPQNPTPPAESRAPDLGQPEDAAPPAPAPEPQPAPAKPKPAEAAPAPKPAEIARPLPAKRPQPAPPQPAKPQTRAPSGALAGIVGRGSGTAPGAKAVRPRGSNLGNVLTGLNTSPSKSNSATPQAATISAAAMMGIIRAIERQIQPCVDRQSRSGLGPGAEDIFVKFHLRFGTDGQLSATPQIVGVRGTNPTNQMYAGRVGEIGLNALRQCSPLNLPAEYYKTPTGGWNDINYTYNWHAR